MMGYHTRARITLVPAGATRTRDVIANERDGP